MTLVALTCSKDEPKQNHPQPAADASADGLAADAWMPASDAAVDQLPGPPDDKCQPMPRLRLSRVGTAREPLAVVQPKGSPNLLVAERAGLIRVISGGITSAAPFLDMRSSVAFFAGRGLGQGERGLVNLTLHPNYADNGRFYVFYTRSRNDPHFKSTRREGDVVVAEGVRSAGNPDVAEPALKELLVIQHDGVEGREGCCDDGHNGGLLAFGPDGLLYIGVGDGGGSGNQFGDAAEGLSTIVRINVDQPEAAVSGKTPWAKGVRNPWRGSFDAKTGDLYFSDVGESTWEEIDYVPATQLARADLDFGWGNPGMEGTREVSYYPYLETGGPAYGVLPIFEYEHPADERSSRVPRAARAVVGGAVYRGQALPNMDGRYFFGDYPTNSVWSLSVVEGRASCVVDHTQDLVTAETPIQGLTGFAQSPAGELYLFDIFGNIYAIENE